MQLIAANYNEGVRWVYDKLEKWLAERDVELVLANCETEDEFISLAKDADIHLAFHLQVTPYILESLPNLKLLMSSGIGYEHLNVEAATRNRVVVTNTASYNVQDVAEHALMLILACSRKLKQAESEVRAGHWQVGSFVQPTHRYDTQTVGLIGFGKIGRTVAGHLKAIGFDVMVYDPYVSPETIQQLGLAPVELDDLLRNADFVSMHSLVTDETRNLLNEERIALMKPSAYVVNTSRGAVIDEVALVNALENKTIAGAALDVLNNEPPDLGNPLLNMDNVLVTGHSAGTSVEGIQAWQDEWREIIEAFIAGRMPINVLNPEVTPKIPLVR